MSKRTLRCEEWFSLTECEGIVSCYGAGSHRHAAQQQQVQLLTHSHEVILVVLCLFVLVPQLPRSHHGLLPHDVLVVCRRGCVVCACMRHEQNMGGGEGSQTEAALHMQGKAAGAGRLAAL